MFFLCVVSGVLDWLCYIRPTAILPDCPVMQHDLHNCSKVFFLSAAEPLQHQNGDNWVAG